MEEESINSWAEDFGLRMGKNEPQNEYNVQLLDHVLGLFAVYS